MEKEEQIQALNYQVMHFKKIGFRMKEG